MVGLLQGRGTKGRRIEGGWGTERRMVVWRKVGGADEGKGQVLGVGRKVGSRNGSRGCCATINTPRDATRHVLLFSTFRSFFFSPSRSAASSLFPTPCACSFFFSLYYSLIPRLSLSLCLFFPFLMLSFPSAPWLYLPPPTRLSSRFSTPFLFSGNLAVFFIF